MSTKTGSGVFFLLKDDTKRIDSPAGLIHDVSKPIRRPAMYDPAALQTFVTLAPTVGVIVIAIVDGVLWAALR